MRLRRGFKARSERLAATVRAGLGVLANLAAEADD